MPDFPMTAVKSSQIAAIGYHGGKLRIRFHDRTNKKTGAVTSGGTYDYLGVESELYEALCKAESVGSHFHAHVRNGGYDYNKVEE